MPKYNIGQIIPLTFATIEIISVSENKDYLENEYIYFVKKIEEGTFKTYTELFITNKKLKKELV